MTPIKDSEHFSQSDRSELLRLIDRTLDQELDEIGRGRMVEMLDASEEARALYVRYTGLAANLYSHAAEMQGQERETEVTDSSRLVVGRFDRIAALGAVAAVLLVSGVAFLMHQMKGSQSSGAFIVDSAEVRLEVFEDGEAQPLEVTGEQDELPLGTLSLSSGWAKLKLKKGTELLVEAPAQFEVLGENSIRVMEGKYAAMVPPSGKGFLVDLPRGELVDLGTQFGVWLEEDTDGAEIHVMEGEAEFGEGDLVVSLPEGRALSIPEDSAEAVVEMEADRTKFALAFDSRSPLTVPVDLLAELPLPFEDSFTIPSGTGAVNQYVGRLDLDLFSSATGELPYLISEGTAANIIGGELVISSSVNEPCGVVLSAPLKEPSGRWINVGIELSQLGAGKSWSGLALSMDKELPEIGDPSHCLVVALERSKRKFSLVVWEDGKQVLRQRLPNSLLEGQSLSVEIVPSPSLDQKSDVLVQGKVMLSGVAIGAETETEKKCYLSLLGGGEGFHIFDNFSVRERQ